MGGAYAVNHSESRIAADVIQARQAHALRRVPIFAPSVCRVRHGEKLVQWGGRYMRAGPRQLILFPAGEELCLTNQPGAHGYYADVVSFTPELLGRFRSRYAQLVDAQLASTSAASLCVPIDRHLGNAWEQLLASFSDDSPAVLQSHYAEGLLLALSLAGCAGPLLMNRRDPLSARVQQLLLLDPAADWEVAGVAGRLHMGASTLRRQLADEGRSFRELLEDVRLGAALQMLQTTQFPVGEIASACGYASASRFAVRFREHFGLSPSTLRAAI